MIRLHHVNVVVPPGRTDEVVPFWEALGLVRVPKHGTRSEGAWLDLPDGTQVHVSERSGGWAGGQHGAAHPEQHVALVVDDLDAVVARLQDGGHPWRPAADLQGRRRGTTADPAGNAVELIAGS